MASVEQVDVEVNTVFTPATVETAAETINKKDSLESCDNNDAGTDKTGERKEEAVLLAAGDIKADAVEKKEEAVEKKESVRKVGKSKFRFSMKRLTQNLPFGGLFGKKRSETDPELPTLLADGSPTGGNNLTRVMMTGSTPISSMTKENSEKMVTKSFNLFSLKPFKFLQPKKKDENFVDKKDAETKEGTTPGTNEKKDSEVPVATEEKSKPKEETVEVEKMEEAAPAEEKQEEAAEAPVNGQQKEPEAPLDQV